MIKLCLESKMKPLKILIINQHTLNHGDDAAGVAMAQQIREQFPNAELHFVYNWPWAGSAVFIPYHNAKTFHYLTLIIRKEHLRDAIRYIFHKVLPILKLKNTFINEYINLVKQSDFVVVAPGGANIGIYKDWISLFRVLVAILEGKKPIFHLNTVGKSNNLIFNWITKYVLKNSQVFVREKDSYDQLKKWRIDSIRGVDTALSLPRKSIIKNSSQKNTDPYLIFIPTRIGTWHPDFKKINLKYKIDNIIIPSLVKFSRKNNLKIKILPHLYGILNEKKLLENIYSHFLSLSLCQEDVNLIKEINDFNDYDRYIAESSIVVSMRYHGIIFAIKNSIPFISLAYENKMKDACNYSGMSDFNFDLTNAHLREEDIVQAMEKINRNKDKISEQITERLPTLERLARLPVMFMYLNSLE